MRKPLLLELRHHVAQRGGGQAGAGRPAPVRPTRRARRRRGKAPPPRTESPARAWSCCPSSAFSRPAGAVLAGTPYCTMIACSLNGFSSVRDGAACSWPGRSKRPGSRSPGSRCARRAGRARVRRALPGVRAFGPADDPAAGPRGAPRGARLGDPGVRRASSRPASTRPPRVVLHTSGLLAADALAAIAAAGPAVGSFHPMVELPHRDRAAGRAWRASWRPSRATPPRCARRAAWPWRWG